MKYLIGVLLLISIVIAGCSKTIYVCYDGTQKDDMKDCPRYPLVIVNEVNAGRAADNFGFGVASAKRVSYTRVNLYMENGSFYSTGLFSNSQDQTFNQIKVKIDGRTSEVTCIEGCEFLQ